MTVPAVRGVKECPRDDCDWSETYRLDWDGEHTAQYRAELHYERDHCGTVRTRVVIEREGLLHPGQNLGDRADHHHDHVQERLVDTDRTLTGYEVAYAVAEITEDPDGPE